MRKKFRSVDSLVHSLCNSNASDRVLQTPTRAVLGKGFLIAKIQFFSLISEDVFISILESRCSADGLRIRAAGQPACI